ncbi:P-loop containing nucleoside triphosphate hydrolase protein [Ascobolus immersus RN42]|uniref:Origin recognition complex subunit 1 n=1 Tax=Ascobolus immersus RN42 TaxID=1160509 RepID=A0A3N4INY1_ASCIM|nr:P-loop containing nucleoside triphosphate hydrolase protein [Ascobolus immersus RN42]
MPGRKSNSTTTSKAERARALLHGGVPREDSDDELGDEDLPWEWIYEEIEIVVPKPKRQKRNAKPETEKVIEIVGAKMGSFECRLGDCLLIKGEGLQGEAFVGLAAEFLESENGEKMCKVMWFSTEFEIKNQKKKRMDYLENELYITYDFNDAPLPSINGHATVTSIPVFHQKYPNGLPKKSKERGKVFICRRAVRPRTATYTEEFLWEDIYHGRKTDIAAITNFVEGQLEEARQQQLKNVGRNSAPKRRTRAASDYEDEEADDVDVPRTPSRRRKATNQSPSKNRLLVTPKNRRIVVKAPLEFTPLALRTLSPQAHSSPFSLARSKLHVSAIPDSLPCRENEFEEVYAYLAAAISEGTGSCIYISGTPGTGKTATVREVVTQLHGAVEAEELEDFIFVEINGMRVVDPHQSYSLLWEAIRGERVSPNHALTLLQAEFSNPSPRRVPCVVLMDELDQLVTKNQSVMYNFFNWPSNPYSKLIVLAVANTMDLPERTLSNKISSRLGLTRITFPGYTHDQLMTIISSRLSGVPENLVDADAIQFAARKVAAVSGDARRALDICRRAVEIAEESAGGQPLGTRMPTTPSKHGRAPKSEKDKGRVTIGVVKQAIQESVSSPLQTYLKSLPTSSKVFLAALLARMRRSGVAENVLADVVDEAERMVKMSTTSATLFDHGGGEKGLLALLVDDMGLRGISQAALILTESGVLGMERGGGRTGRVRLNVPEEEIKGALRGDTEVGSLLGR